MHHFLYPTKDTFITNRGDYSNKNFGVDEILGVGTKNTATNVWRDTKEYDYANSYVTDFSVDSFFGTASASSFSGKSAYISGSISNSGDVISFSSSYFSGSLTGSIDGIETGSTVFFVDYSGSLSGFSGSILTAEFINGFVSGSVITDCQRFFTYNGVIQNLDGVIYYGYLTGKETKNEKNLLNTYKKYPNRTLMQFNLASISASIASGEISTPNFVLNLKIAKEEELPIQYNVYAFPINQSWEMGNGYYYDGGSAEGCNWEYKDEDNGTFWYPIIDTASLAPIDFVTHPEQASGSWARGGGTWYTSSAYICSQSFDYQTSDIVMDVNTIAHGWLSRSISNYGIILMSSDEFSSTGSQFDLSFFSKDTNTVYSPYLDTGWADQAWSTGSVTLTGTSYNVSSGSVNLLISSGYLLSGSTDIVSGSSGVNVSASLSGSFGLCHPASTAGGVLSGEVTAIATSGPFSGVTITGNVLGTASGPIISGSFTSGQLIGCQFTGLTLPFWTGYISGSTFSVDATGSYRMNGSSIVGVTNDQGVIIAVIAGYLVTGNITGSYSNGQFLGQVQNGWAAGYYVSASVTGLYSTSSANTASFYTSRSLDPLQTNLPFVVVVQNLPPTVKANNIIRVNVFGREEFPLKNFTRATQLTQFLTPKYLPISSYYALKDNETEQIVQDFDDYTKLSCDMNGNYFMIDTSGLPQERYYRILIKIEQSSSVYILDHGNIFKVIR